VEAVIGLDDHSNLFTMLYTDSRGVCRPYRMSLDSNSWTLQCREASQEGRDRSTDFAVAYRRLPG
jgi:hypothetical protein